MLDRLRALLRRPTTAEHDVEPDAAVARTRETGGALTERGDSASTTGTGRTEGFVGRVAGQDLGHAEESGAERRRKRRGRQIGPVSSHGAAPDG